MSRQGRAMIVTFGVAFVLQVWLIAEELPIDDLELASVFLNLIDAALGECRAQMSDSGAMVAEQHPAIRLRSLVQANQLFVEVRCPCGSRAKRLRRFARRADPSLFMELGTATVTEIATKHGGIAEFDVRDGIMEARVLIPLQD